MTDKIITIFYYVLFILFLSGAVIIAVSFKGRSDISVLIRNALIAVFFMHFLIYALAGMMNIALGWQRNFFYLLPIFFLILFYFLRKITRHKAYYYAFSGILLIPFLWLNIQNSFSWENNNLWREMIRVAGKAGCDSLIISPREIYEWPLKYYAKKYDIQHKTLFLYRYAKRNEISGVTQELQNAGRFIVIQPFRGDFLSREDKGFLDAGSFEMLEEKEYPVESGPYVLLRKMIEYPKRCITVYSYKKKQK